MSIRAHFGLGCLADNRSAGPSCSSDDASHPSPEAGRELDATAGDGGDDASPDVDVAPTQAMVRFAHLSAGRARVRCLSRVRGTGAFKGPLLAQRGRPWAWPGRECLRPVVHGRERVSRDRPGTYDLRLVAAGSSFVHVGRERLRRTRAQTRPRATRAPAAGADAEESDADDRCGREWRREHEASMRRPSAERGQPAAGASAAARRDEPSGVRRRRLHDGPAGGRPCAGRGRRAVPCAVAVAGRRRARGGGRVSCGQSTRCPAVTERRLRIRLGRRRRGRRSSRTCAFGGGRSHGGARARGRSTRTAISPSRPSAPAPSASARRATAATSRRPAARRSRRARSPRSSRQAERPGTCALRSLILCSDNSPASGTLSVCNVLP